MKINDKEFHRIGSKAGIDTWNTAKKEMRKTIATLKDTDSCFLISLQGKEGKVIGKAVHNDMAKIADSLMRLAFQLMAGVKEVDRIEFTEMMTRMMSTPDQEKT